MCSLFYNYAEANSEEFCEEISFPSFLRNMRMRGYPHFSLRISLALAKIYFLCVVLTWHKTFVFSTCKHCTVLKFNSFTTSSTKTKLIDILK